MEARDYKELKKMLCKELEEVKESNKLGMAEIEIIDKLTHTIKNIDRIMENEDEDYSHGGEWRADGNYSRGRYSRTDGSDNSYAGRRGTHYVRGHYSRNDGSYGNGMNYSYADGMDQIISQMQEMVDDDSIPSAQRSSIRKAMDMISR